MRNVLSIVDRKHFLFCIILTHIIIQGSERELTNIDPVLKVYHDCDDGIKPGQRKLKFYIPDHYISSGGRPRKVFNLGTINLETIFKCEERDLL
ncbi:Transthyretin family protein [Trichostrongylus colubriformis]|uniref:Transthyretin family protein n=1 Tax=Trichostrongylus colubriformis TaxID=6319 RepID=A0AAN8F6W2_TRICO